MRYLLDTNICIYALKNRPPEVLQRLQEVGREAVAVSVVTVLELRHGAENSQQPVASHLRLDFFLKPIPVLNFEQDDALAGARVRAHLQLRGTPIGDFDNLIAAQAIARNLILITNNVLEFARVPGLQVENWVR